MRIDLSGKVALVTGGSRGLGRAIALRFAEAGADVIVASRTLADCEAVAAEIVARHDRRALALACQVGRWAECDRLVEQAVAAFGRVDILVNNAGMPGAFGAPETIDEEMFDKTIAVNLRGTFRLSALVGAHMVERGGGAIVNISSSSATHPLAEGIVYSASKAAINNMTKSFAARLGPTVRVNAVQPWGMETDMSSFATPELIAELSREMAIKRFARPDEVAVLAVLLASDASSFTTGSVMRVDGGLPG